MTHCPKCNAALDPHGEHFKACGKSTNPEYLPLAAPRALQVRRNRHSLPSLDRLNWEGEKAAPGRGIEWRLRKRAA